MTELPLTFAALDYDRLNPLRDRRVRPEGIDLNFITLPVEETFYRQAVFEEFDVSEMSLSSYVLTLDRENPPFVAIPVFPSRYFRHQSIFVNERSGIREPKDLIGKRVGVPEYQITACVWQRGILEDDYGVSPTQIRWFSGGVERPGRSEKVPLSLPEEIDISPIGPDQTLSEMLAAGELDAAMIAGVPPSFTREAHVKRLFEDYKSVEQDYFARTQIFPIMHVIVIKRDVLERQPWVARSLMKAFDASLAIAKDDLLHRSALKIMLPWLSDHVEETVSVMGEHPWAYGVEENRHVLDTFLRYSHAQGLASRKWKPEEIFAKSAVGEYVI